MRSVSPEKRTHFAGHLNRVVNAQALQRLNVKYPIVEITLSAFVSVNTLPLTKELFDHRNSPFLAPPGHETQIYCSEASGIYFFVSSNRASEILLVSELTNFA